jgi:hypothetical protein
MTTTINADTTNGVKITSDTSGVLGLQTNGNTAVTINGSQNVGIGTTTPDIFSRGYGRTVGINDSGSSGAVLQINSASSYSALELGRGGVRKAFFTAQSTVTELGNLEAVPLAFYTNSAERARIDSSGNLGIGTTSPDAKLDVTSIGTASAYTVTAVIQDAQYPASGNSTLEFNGFIGGNGYRSGIGSIGGQQLAFYTPSTFGVAPTERARIDSSGNLLVGTTTASANFYVYNAPVSYAGLNTTAIFSSSASQSTGTGGLIAFEGKYTSGGSLANFAAIGGLKENSTDSNYSGYLGFYTRLNGSLPAERMRLDSSGKLLLGVTSGTGLSVGDFAMANGKAIRFRNAADSAYISAFEFNTSNGLDIGKNGSLATITFGISGIGEVSRFDTSGQLLVGTTTSAGAVSNTKRIVGGSFSSFNGVLNSVSSGVAYTMFTMTADFTSYLVTVSALVSTAAYSETAIVHLNNTSVNVIVIAGGSAITIQNTGMAVQVYQSSGATVSELIWSAIRIT